MEQNKEVEYMPPQKTWFFTDSTGRIFSTNEQEAFCLLTQNSRWRRQDIKMIGMSDGTTYYKTVREAGQKTKELAKQIEEVKETLNKYVAGHDKLMFEQFLDESDERVQRAKKLIKETEDKLKPLEDEFKNLKSNIIQMAFDAELEQARGNMVNPRDFTVIAKTDGAIRNKGVLENFINSKRVL